MLRLVCAVHNPHLLVRRSILGHPTWAKKAQYQYGHAGLIKAIRSGEMEHKALEIRTSHMAGTRWMK